MDLGKIKQMSHRSLTSQKTCKYHQASEGNCWPSQRKLSCLENQWFRGGNKPLLHQLYLFEHFASVLLIHSDFIIIFE